MYCTHGMQSFHITQNTGSTRQVKDWGHRLVNHIGLNIQFGITFCNNIGHIVGVSTCIFCALVHGKYIQKLYTLPV